MYGTEWAPYREDNVIVEIIDPVTLQPVKEGEVGEMVLTTINREAMPLLRYRTRDLTCVLPGECPCGRTHKRLARFKGRSDDMIILKGVNLFPIRIEKILMQFKELGSNYLITIETVGNNDEMLIEVELSDLFTDDYSVFTTLDKGNHPPAERRAASDSPSQTGRQRLPAGTGWKSCPGERLA